MLTLSSVPPALLGWALLSLICSPLIIPFVMTRARTVPAFHRARVLGRARRRGEARPVATPAEQLERLGFVDRPVPALFDVEVFDGPDPRAGEHLSDAEVVAVAASLNPEWSATPNADDVEQWLADLTRRDHP